LIRNRALREVFGPKKQKVSGDERKLRKEELGDLYSSLNIISVVRRKMRWVWHVVRTGDMRNTCRGSVRKPGGRRPPGRPVRRWADNIKMSVKEDRTVCAGLM
jgi:hypothetical protein